MNLRNYLPFLQWLPGYSRTDLRGDVSAGLTVGVMLIPQGMAYAMLAGLPPIYGLYASTIPLILYALFGTSRQLAVGPVAMVSLLIATGVGQLAEVGSAEFIGLAILLSLMVGVMQFSLGLFRLGFLVNFLSHPVISGFTSAAALIIGMSQLKHLLGIDIPRSHHVHKILMGAAENIGTVHLPTLLLGLSGIAVIIFIKRMKWGIPGPLVAVVLSIVAVYFLGLHEGGMKIVKEVPSGLPSVSFPTLDVEGMRSLLPIAITISLVGFMESIAVAKAIQAKHKNYQVESNQELIGLGLANIGGALFNAFPTTGGFSRTAVNDQSGAKTGMASIISAVLIILTLLFLTPLFYYLPKAVLASVIMVAVFGLIDVKEARHLWNTDRRDFAMLLVTFLATLSLGIEQGIGVGVVLSLGMVIYRSTYPHVAILGKLPGTTRYRNIARFPEVVQRPDVLMIRFDAQLFFANSTFFREKLAAEAEKKGDALRLVVLDFAAVNGLDSSAAHSLHDLALEYQQRGITLYVAAVKGPIRDTMFRSGLMNDIGRKNFFISNEEAMEYWDHPERVDRAEEHPGVQTNVHGQAKQEGVAV